MSLRSYSTLYALIAASTAIALVNVVIAYWWISRPASIELEGIPKAVSARVGELPDAYIEATSSHFLSLLLTWNSTNRNLRIVEANKMLSDDMHGKFVKWIKKYYDAISWFDKNQTFHLDRSTIVKIGENKWRVTASGMLTSYYNGLGQEKKPLTASLIMRQSDPNNINPFVVCVTGLSVQ